jgi:hypothetical protein
MTDGASGGISLGRVALVALTLLWVALGVAGYVLESPLVHVAVVLFPLGIFFIRRPDWVLIFALVALQGQLLVPGLPRGIGLSFLLMAGFVVIVIARLAILKTPPARSSRLTLLAVLGLLVVLAATAWQRGFGLRSMDGGAIGGAQYVKVGLAAVFVLFASHVTLRPRQWKIAIVLMVAASFLPLVAQLLFVVSGGRLEIQYLVIQPYVYGLLESLDASQGGDRIFRLQMLSPVATNICLATLALIPATGWRRPLWWGFLGLALGCAALSGFRTAVVYVAMITLLFILRTQGWRALRPMIPLAVLALVAIVVTAPFADRLPYAIQRAFSWLPFVHISPLVRLDAETSTSWRLDLWRYALTEVRNYWLLGRGLTIDLGDAYSYALWRDPIAYQFAMHNYHNGPLWMLLDLGAFGLAAGAGFLLASAREVIVRRAVCADPFLDRVIALYEAVTIYGVVSFFFIFGDASTLANACLNLAILRSLRATARRAAATPAPSAAAAAEETALRNRALPLPYFRA